MKKVCLLLWLLAGSNFLWAQSSPGDELQKADSLFESRKYTESFEIYSQLFDEERQVSPAMLLRMAFIKEGLGNYSSALYYLNLYYLHTSDKKVLAKMEELAEKKTLEGYEFSDWEFIKTVFYKYFMFIVIFLLALAILLLTLVYNRKVRHHKNPAFAGLMMVLTLILLFYTLNFGRDYNRSLTDSSTVYVMSGPSAGAEVIAIIGKGHRVSVGKSQDVWTEIEWKGQKGFVKNDKLKPITF